MSHHFFPMISRMRYINRWGLMRNTRLENIQEHSHQVAVLAHALAVIQNRYFGGQIDPGQVAVAALYHDNPTIQSAYKEVEAVAEQKLLNMLPEDLRPAYDEALTIPDPQVRALVKAADKLSAYLKCVEEVKAGNNEFKKAKEQTYAALCQNQIPALRYFMDRFLDGFELTLDELSEE